MLLSIILFKLSLDIAYVAFVSSEYEYQGYLLDVNFYNYAISWVLVLLASSYCPKKITFPSDIFGLIYLIGLCIPFSTYIGLGEGGVFVFLSLISFYFFVFWASSYSLGGSVARTFFLPKLFLNGWCFWSVILVVLTLFIFNFLVNFKYLSFNTDVTRVYDYRAGLKEHISWGYYSYLNVWVSKVCLAVFISYSLFKKSISLFVISVVLSVIVFFVSQSRSTLIFPFYIILFFLWLSYGGITKYLVYFFTIVVVLSLFAYMYFDQNLYASLFIRRSFFSVVVNVQSYFEFFDVHSFVYWSNTAITRWFLEYPYELSPGNLIGEYKNIGGNANTSIVATGFMHAGYLGVVLYSLIMALLLRFINVLYIHKSIPIFLFVMPALLPLRGVLLSTDLVVALLSQGLFFSLLLMLLMPNKPK